MKGTLFLFALRDRKPLGWWKSHSNQKEFLKEAVASKDLASPLFLKRKDLIEAGGAGLLRHFPVLQEAILFHFKELPDRDLFHPRHSLPKNFWKQPENQLRFLKHFEEQRGIDTTGDWHSITKKDILQSGGRGLFDVYSSLADILKTLRPGNEWDSFRLRRRMTNKYWNDPLNHRKFFDRLGCTLNLQTLEEWNEVSVATIKRHGGGPLLLRYPSVAQALQEIYSELPWEEYERLSLPQKYWDNPDHIRDFLRRVSVEYQIDTAEDWYRISRFQLIRMKGARLLQKYGGLHGILEAFFPEVNWDRTRMQSSRKRASQRWLFLQLSKLLPSGVEALEDFLWTNSGKATELDIYVPAWSLALEYQGEHHYHDSPYFGNAELYQSRDEEKRNFCQTLGINLIHIPYWWTGSSDDLRTFLLHQVPLLPLVPPTKVATNLPLQTVQH